MKNYRDMGPEELRLVLSSLQSRLEKKRERELAHLKRRVERNKTKLAFDELAEQDQELMGEIMELFRAMIKELD